MTAWLYNGPLLADWATGALSGLEPDKRFVLIVIVIGCATGVLCTIVTSVTHAINSIHRRRTEVEMKRDMIERGMSADEITKIIEAAPPLEDGAQRWIASWGKRAKRT